MILRAADLSRLALGIDAAHRGGHRLRHACASRLLPKVCR